VSQRVTPHVAPLHTVSISGVAMSHHRAIRYAIMLAQGMLYLHTCKPPILHRDLKPANRESRDSKAHSEALPPAALQVDTDDRAPSAAIMSPVAPSRYVTVPSSQRRARRLACAVWCGWVTVLLDFNDNLKVSDFGLAKLRPELGTDLGSAVMMTGETGSYRYMAPEVFRHEAVRSSYSNQWTSLYLGRAFPFCCDRLVCLRVTVRALSRRLLLRHDPLRAALL
jgi:serine/threonine protein kinase